ncbi:MAG: TonB-dependent receptor [Prevotellaceae bacterium]|jgi:outer membrane cobalamin receptor|nr:TonB-dependent receptor [Prevotellaceae bacterium]
MNRFNKFTFIIATCLISAIFSTAQNTSWTVSGRILDKTNMTIEFANVLLYSSDSTLVAHTVTNSEGFYSLNANKQGNYRLLITMVGYDTQTENIFLENEVKKLTVSDIILNSENNELSEIEIITRKNKTVYRLDKKIIEASGYISASGGTATDILSQFPSIKTDADGGISFRGSSGFKVYIDGKPSSLTGSEALEQIPAGQVENIEIISTPSARHEADGIAGIINVITKKQTVNGWSGTVNTMASSVKSRNIDFLTSYRKNSLKWQTSGEFSRRYMVSDFKQHKKIDITDTLTVTDITGERKTYVDIYSLKSGLEWYKPHTTFSASGEGRYRVRHRGGTLHYDDKYLQKNTGIETAALFNGNDFVHLYEMTYRGDVGFEHRFSEDGHKLTGSFLSFYEANAMEYFYTDLFDLSGNRSQGHRAWEYEYRITAQANLDYIKPFNNQQGKFEAGYYFFSYTEDGDYKIDMYSPAVNDFVRHDELYNKYLFRRDIHALYSILSNTCANFAYQLGLRGEFMHRKLENNKIWARHVWDKFDLFPSIHLDYSINDKSKLNFGYSRRITQPQLFYMEPYVVYVDFYTAQCGNPMIRPEYTNSLELTYSKEFGNNSISAGLFHRIRKDKIERVRVPYHTGVTLDSMSNVGNDYATGAEFSCQLQANKYWGFDINGSMYHYSIENQYKITDKDTKSMNWQLAFNNNFDVAKNTRMRLDAYYVGPSVSTQGRVNDFFYCNFSVRQQFFERKFSAILNVRDIFSTAKYVSTQTGVNLDSQTTIYPKSPLFTLSLTYTFNNFKSQKKTEKVSHDLFEGTNR